MKKQKCEEYLKPHRWFTRVACIYSSFIYDSILQSPAFFIISETHSLLMLSKKNIARLLAIVASALLINIQVSAQNQYELNSGWKCKKAGQVNNDGAQISAPGFSTDSWEKATVPGTVLTTQLNNGQIPDPFYGMNNNLIPDIYKAGRDYYTKRPHRVATRST
jgi:hypothetical protein